MAVRDATTSLQAIFMAMLMLTIGANADYISIYWGQTPFEGTLADTCATRNHTLYQIVNLAFLDTFGGGRAPGINLGSHCNSYNSSGCSNLTSDIKSCQEHGIKVFLSIGGPYNASYSLSSHADAKKVAAYLWNNFLGGKNSSSRPLGPAILDGINFDIQGGNGLYWDTLAKYLARYRRKGTKVYLTAAPKCSFPDPLHGKALDTGLFDYVWPRFYNNSACQQQGYDNITGLVSDWRVWTTRTPASKIFFGMIADVEVPGFIFLCETHWVIMNIQNVSNSKYGGVTIWSEQRYYNVESYSERIPYGECP